MIISARFGAEQEFGAMLTNSFTGKTRQKKKKKQILVFICNTKWSKFRA